MELTSLWIIFFTFWVLSNFWLLPILRNRWVASNLRTKAARAGSLAVLEKARDLATVGMITLAAVVILLELSDLFLSSTNTASKALMGATAGLYKVAKSLKEGYGTALSLFSIAGSAYALIHCGLTAKKRIVQAWQAKAQEVYARLVDHPEQIDEARNDQSLRPFVESIDQVLKRGSEYTEGTNDAQFSESAEVEVQRIRFELSASLSALAFEIARKELDVDGAFSVSDVADHVAEGRWGKLLGALASKRLSKELGLLSKPFSYVATSLLIITLIAWSSEPIANSLQLSVNNLRVNVLAQQATRELNDAIARVSPAKSDPNVQSKSNPFRYQQAAHRIAQASIREMLRSHILADSAHVKATREQETEFVRNSILENSMSSASADASPDASGDVRKEVADNFDRAAPTGYGSKAAEDRVAAEIEPSIEEIDKRDPGLLDHILEQINARYAEPIDPLSAQNVLIDNIIDEAFSISDFHATSQASKEANKLLNSFGKEAVKTWVQSAARKFVTQAILDTAHPEAWSQVQGRFQFETTSEAKTFISSLYGSRGTEWHGPSDVEADVNERVAAQIAKTVLPPEVVIAERDIPTGPLAELENSLGGYDKLFPAEGGEEFYIARARNFNLAMLSFRIRGVIIGQDSPTIPLDITGLRWTFHASQDSSPTQVTLEARLGDQWRDLGTFEAGIINQALRFAADGRVIATTIAPGDGEIIGRVTYLHPSLIDTPLGCRIVESDRVIDTFTSSEANVQIPHDLDQLASDRSSVWQWMKNVGLAENVANKLDAGVCPRAYIENSMRQPGYSATSAERLSPAIDKAIHSFLDAKEKQLPGSTEFLRAATSCSNGPTDKRADCLCEHISPVQLSNRYWYPEDHTSQLREKSWTRSADFRWMQPSPDFLDNFDLAIHTTFALRGANDRSSDESTATAIDFPSDELLRLRQVVSRDLPRYVKEQERDSSYRDFLEPVEQFVLMQRFARSALNGSLGPNFPLRRLAELARATRAYVPAQTTIRWEPVALMQTGDPRMDPETRATKFADFLTNLKEADPRAATDFREWFSDEQKREEQKLPRCAQASR